MATYDVASITSHVPGEERLIWRKAVGNSIPPCVTPAAELMLYCYLNLHLQWLPGHPLILIAITLNNAKLGEGI